MLGEREETLKERCICKEERRNVEIFIYQSKKEVNRQFGRKVNQNIREKNRSLGKWIR